MGENEEKKEEIKVKTPQEQIQDFQQQQKEAAEQQEASIKAANDAYQQGFQQRSEQLKGGEEQEMRDQKNKQKKKSDKSHKSCRSN